MVKEPFAEIAKGHTDIRKSAKILLLDIETSPLVCYTWGLYEQNVIKKLKQFTILSVAYQWLGQKTKVIACDSQTEFSLLKKLHKLLDAADIVIAHNGDSFDIKKINSRFMVNKLYPPSPYKTIDTKKVARSVAGFDSNSLNNLGLDLSEGEKVKHRGFEMWEGCMAGKKRDWEDMKRYNKKDVDLLAMIYLRLRPWMKNHPPINPPKGEIDSCDKCGSSNIQSRGKFYTRRHYFRRYRCSDCGGWISGPRVSAVE